MNTLKAEHMDPTKLPRHIAVIMDGNGRWAKQHGKTRLDGHKQGTKAMRDVLDGAVELGIENITFYAFSIENWRRPKYEVAGLMRLFVSIFSDFITDIEMFRKNSVRVTTIGDVKQLPKSCQKLLNKVIDLTKNHNKTTVTLALSYSSRWEITEATRQIAERVKSGELDTSDINENVFAAHLSTAGTPDPELLIRTSGELRISNYLLWQLAYAELYFTQKMWPDFRREDLFEAVREFQHRERRFGLTSEQLNENP